MNGKRILTHASLLWGGVFFLLWLSPNDTRAQSDYSGYRLYVKDVEVVRRATDFIKVRCTIVNTGSKPIDLSRRDQAHWVTINYDPGFFDARLGGYRSQFVEGLFGQRLVLQPGEVSRRRTVVIRLFERPMAQHPAEQKAPATPRVLFSAKGGEGYRTHDSLQRDELPCGDLTFGQVRITRPGKRWMEVEFAVANEGKGPVPLKGKRSDGADGVRIAAYVSGVPELTRGAILLGEQLLHTTTKVESHVLQPGQTLTGYFRFDIRARTRYLNVLILQLQTFGIGECDNTNNTTHLILP